MTEALTSGDLEELREALKLGSRLLAVRIYREKTGAGLADAARFIDGLLELAQSISHPSRELMERVVALVSRGIDDGATEQEQERLSREYPEAQLIAAFAQAHELCNQAYTLCDQHRAGLLTYEAVLNKLQQTCPGFTPTAYETARSAGMRDSR